MRPDLQETLDRLDQVIATTQAGHLPTLLAVLNAKLGMVVARLVDVQQSLDSNPSNLLEENLSIREAARRIGMSRDWLYKHAGELPFSRKIGRRILFSAAGLERWNLKRKPLEKS